MNINDFVKAKQVTQYLGRSARVEGTAGVGASSQSGLSKAERRIQEQVDNATSQLSFVGKLKSTVLDVQLASRGLGAMVTGTSTSGEKAKLSAFVGAFNTAIKMATATSDASGEAMTIQGAARVGQDLKRAVSSDPATLDALKKVGIIQSLDGTLVLDHNKYDLVQKSDRAGVSAALKKIGKELNIATTRELAMDGNLGLSLTYLNQKAGVLNTRQSALAALSESGSILQAGKSPATLNHRLSAYFKW
jgi:hypothetical protein